jgi:hypothetical protein
MYHRHKLLELRNNWIDECEIGIYWQCNLLRSCFLLMVTSFFVRVESGSGNLKKGDRLGHMGTDRKMPVLLLQRKRGSTSHRACRIPSQVCSCAICRGQIGTGADFLRLLRFPSSILISSNAQMPHFAHLSSGTVTMDHLQPK